MKYIYLGFLVLLLSACQCNWPYSEKESYIYTVKKGDNLSVIAKNNNISVDDLIHWNDITETTIYPGQKIHIYFPTTYEDKIKFGMTKSQVIDILKMPSIDIRYDSCAFYSYDIRWDSLHIDRLVYNLNPKSMKINNRFFCDPWVFDTISYIHFGFYNDLLSCVQITRREGRNDFNTLIENTKKSGFTLTKTSDESYYGTGKKYNENTIASFYHQFENAITWETYYRRLKPLSILENDEDIQKLFEN